MRNAKSSGQALVLVIMVTGLMLMLGGAALELGLMARKNCASEVIHRKSYYIARAGIECAQALLGQDPELVKRVENGETVELVPDPMAAAYEDGFLDYVRVSRVTQPDSCRFLIESQGGYGRGRVRLTRVVATL